MLPYHSRKCFIFIFACCFVNTKIINYLTQPNIISGNLLIPHSQERFRKMARQPNGKNFRKMICKKQHNENLNHDCAVY